MKLDDERDSLYANLLFEPAQADDLFSGDLVTARTGKVIITTHERRRDFKKVRN